MSIIYLLSSILDYEEYHKIGYSTNKSTLLKRFDNIKTSNPGNMKILYTFNTKHNRKVETALHNYFNNKQVNREWFKLNIEDVNNFKKICEKLENNFNILLENNNPYY